MVQRELQEIDTVEIWPLGIDFGEVLAQGVRSRTMIKNQGPGIRLSRFKP